MASPHEETIIRMGHPDQVRHRYQCADSGCGWSFIAAESTSTNADGDGD